MKTGRRQMKSYWQGLNMLTRFSYVVRQDSLPSVGLLVRGTDSIGLVPCTSLLAHNPCSGSKLDHALVASAVRPVPTRRILSQITGFGPPQ